MVVNTEENSSAAGLVISSVGGLYGVEVGDKVVKCRARGIFRNEGITVTVGDRVKVGYENDGSAAIEEVEERRSLLIRPPLANLDVLMIVFAVKKPLPVLETIDKLTCIVRHNNILPVLVITKCELDRSAADEYAAIYRLSTYPVFPVSAETGEGLDALNGYIRRDCRGKMCAFAGASGVGKSTLLSRLFSHLAPQAGGLSKIERGRHTTRSVDLYPIDPGDAGAGKIADTPGFSMLDFTRFDFFRLDSLAGTFPEFDPYLGHCRYTKCSHTKEEGCAILDALHDGRIAPSRHASYLSLYAELKKRPDWEK